MREIAGVRIPDSKLSVAALDLIKAESHASIYKHVLRTFVFGALAAGAEGIRFDEELFFPSAILHDLGLTERYGTPAGRFEVVGADAARSYLSAQGVAAERAAIVWEAIALHTSNGIALRRAPEVVLVHIGAPIDVMGLGLEKLPKTVVQQTIEALPRDNFKKVFVDALFARVQKDPLSVALTWMSEAARKHVHGFEWSPPDTKMAKDAEVFARETHTGDLLSHAYRSYYFGAIIASYNKLRYDKELYFTAAVLHDIGLTDSRAVPLKECCFAVSGGRQIHDFLLCKGHPPEKARIVGDAISAHLNLHLPVRSYGEVAALVAKGCRVRRFWLWKAVSEREVQKCSSSCLSSR